MDFIDLCRIRLPSEFNRELDKFLCENKYLPNELINRFNDAYKYGNSTPMQWLISKLKILSRRIENNVVIELEEGTILDNTNFNEWVKKLYPDIYQNVFFQ